MLDSSCVELRDGYKIAADQNKPTWNASRTEVLTNDDIRRVLADQVD